MNDIIIFEFDGVLADTQPFMLQMSGEVCAQLGHLCTPTPADLDALQKMNFDDLARQLGVPEGKVPEYTRRILEAFNTHPEPMPAFHGIEQIVPQLADRFRLGLVTGNGAGVVRKYLAHYGLERCFEMILSLEDPGSRVEKIQRILSTFGNGTGQAYMVGDAVSDIHAARQAGISSVAVAWGHQSLAKLRRANPDIIAEKPADLLTIFPLDL
jgi:phosphoglycolate phosphatase-like HAD superfamily hydrolase